MRNLRGTIFYTKTNVLQDFHICISVPLIVRIELPVNENALKDLKYK